MVWWTDEQLLGLKRARYGNIVNIHSGYITGVYRCLAEVIIPLIA
jgi:hypothetical protein